MELSKKIRRRRDDILRTVELGYSNARVETFNNRIKVTIRMAYGFRKVDSLIAMNICSFQGHCYCRRRPIALFDDYCGSRPPLLRIKATGC